MDNTVAVILAAGEGKRMRSNLPKVMHEVLYKPMIDWVVDAAKGSGIGGICVVVGNGGEIVMSHLKSRGESCGFAFQKEQLGTGHAVKQAIGYIKEKNPENVLVLCGDSPFISSDIIKTAYYSHCRNENDVTVLTAQAKDPAGYGRILRDDEGDVIGIVEDGDATPEQQEITEINAGAYWFGTNALLKALEKLERRNLQGEYYLTDTVGIIGGDGQKGGTCQLDMKYIAAANDRKQLLELNSIARGMVFDRLLSGGVSFIDASGIIIGPDVKIGRDTLILPGTILKGGTIIGNGCTIGPNSVIENCKIGDNAVINASQAKNSVIGNGVTVGPFSNIRPDCDIGENVHIGDFVEVKNSGVGKGTKIAHLTYVGDSDVGGNVNFGCGVVTSNYDGVSKYRTTVGEGAFIGCNTNLVAPVKVGDGAYTAAGSTITKDVPAGALAVSRSRQQNIEGWADKKLKGRKK